MSQPPEPPAEGSSQPQYGQQQPPPTYGQPPAYGQQPGFGPTGYPPSQVGYPPPGYPVPPPKQSHVLRNVLLILAGLLVLGCGGCFAVVGFGLNQANKAITKAQENDTRPGGPANPLDVQEGRAFAINGMDFHRGWRLDSSGPAGTTIENLQVTAHRQGDQQVTELVTFTFYRHGRVLSEATCAAEPLSYGETADVTCTPTGRVLEHVDRVTVNDTF
ncbi:MAG: hypothetical protein QOK15_2465 [Nocardioidaceae bacterium]|jgi:hypothetical protein|nr:hypothetical protein [Nocardioidaceae bacterium]